MSNFQSWLEGRDRENYRPKDRKDNNNSKRGFVSGNARYNGKGKGDGSTKRPNLFRTSQKKVEED